MKKKTPKVRKGWGGLDPRTRVKPGRQEKYNRAREKRDDQRRNDD